MRTLQVCVFAFDCLYHNGVSLLHEPLTKRRETLASSLKEVPGQVTQATTKISNDVEELEVRGVFGWEGGGREGEGGGREGEAAVKVQHGRGVHRQACVHLQAFSNRC